MTNKKQQLGQFFTKNSDYVLNGFNRYIKGKNIIDPFAGDGDLLMWAKDNGAKSVKGYDMDKAYVDNKLIFKNDSINNPLKYKFGITNPPYLNINKASESIKKKFLINKFEDLYHASLNSILNSDEGIVIVPINFLSARNSKKIRDVFFTKFRIVQMNYFKHQVFPDTTYNVISFYYKKKNSNFDYNFSIKTTIFPDNKKIDIALSKDYDWAIGGELIKLMRNQKNHLGVRRLTEKDIEQNKGDKKIKAAFNHVKEIRNYNISKKLYDSVSSNIILLKAIDSGSDKGKIALENIKNYNIDCLVSKESSRHMIYLVFDKNIDISEQKKLINIFNKEINELRDKYLSLFLTNYRDNDRKRVGFDFVYKYLNHLYFNEIKNYDKRQSVLL
jgi:hypothetical protein